MKRKLAKILTVITLAVICLCIAGVSAYAAYYGDVDLDGKVTASDARKVLRHSAKIETLADSVFTIADVNLDKNVNASDARLILRMGARLDALKEIETDSSENQPTTPPEDNTPDIKEDVVLVSGLDFGGDTGIYPDEKSVKVQALSDFGKTEMTIYGSSQNGLTLTQKFSGSKDDEAVIKEYVELLNQDSMNFTLADSYYRDYGTQIFASWGFNYTGTGKVKNTCDINFIDDEEPCAISIYYTVDRNSFTGYIYWSASLDMDDLGFRCGNGTESVAPAGESACTGLIRTADGKYKTTDGRFCVKPGEIQMYVDGTEEKCSFEYRLRNICDYIKILDSSGAEKFRIFLSESKTPFTGEILEADDILLDGQWGDWALSGITSDMTQIYQYVNKAWLRPSYEDNPYEDLTFRTVYYNESEKIAVFYLYTYILDETELLFVVDLNNVIDETQNSSDGGSGSDVSGSGGYEQPEFSKLDCTFCDNGDCSNCNGYGTVYSNAIGSDKLGIICSKCSGTGNCFYCGGTGKR